MGRLAPYIVALFLLPLSLPIAVESHRKTTMIKLPGRILAAEPIRHSASQSPSTPTFYNAFDTSQNRAINPANNYDTYPFNYDKTYEKNFDGSTNSAQYQSELPTQYQSEYSQKDPSNPAVNDATNVYPTFSKSLTTSFSYDKPFHPADEAAFRSSSFDPYAYALDRNVNPYNQGNLPTTENNRYGQKNSFNSQEFEQPSLAQQQGSTPFDSFSMNGKHDLTYGQVQVP